MIVGALAATSCDGGHVEGRRGKDRDGSPTTPPAESVPAPDDHPADLHVPDRDRPLGSVTLLETDVRCKLGALEDATCQRVRVGCPGLPDIVAELAITPPETAKSAGTVLVHRGSEGTLYFRFPETIERFPAEGFSVVQVRWQRAWENTPDSGILEAACRPATLLQYVYETVHRSDTDTGFCAFGHSAGGGAIAYALAHYGRDAVIDHALIAAGPPFARIDYGCAPQTYGGPPLALCPELADAPLPLPFQVMDVWSNTTTCGSDTPDPDDLARWKADSIVSAAADLDYPHTRLDFFTCATRPNGTAGGTFLFSSAVTSEHEVTCVTDCRIESLGRSWADAADRLLEQCVPRHGSPG